MELKQWALFVKAEGYRHELNREIKIYSPIESTSRRSWHTEVKQEANIQ